MPEQIRIKPAKRKKVEEPPVEETAKVSGHTSVEDIDAMLDEIDSLLEENAEEFVRAYQQKGGQ